MREALKAESAILAQSRERLSLHHLALPKDSRARSAVSQAMHAVSTAIEYTETAIERLESEPTPPNPNFREG
jgi:hypothetical protein